MNDDRFVFYDADRPARRLFSARGPNMCDAFQSAPESGPVPKGFAMRVAIVNPRNRKEIVIAKRVSADFLRSTAEERKAWLRRRLRAE